MLFTLLSPEPLQIGKAVRLFSFPTPPSLTRRQQDI